MSNISVSVRRSHIFQPGTYCFCLSVLAPSVACTSVHSVAAVCSVACTSVACNSVHSVAAVCSVQCCLQQCWILCTEHCAQCCTVSQQCAVCTVLQECAPAHCSGACQRCLQQCPHLHTVGSCAHCWLSVLAPALVQCLAGYQYIMYTHIYYHINFYILLYISSNQSWSVLASACQYGHDTTFFADNGFYASARASHWYNLSNYFGFRLWNIMIFWHFSSNSINIQQWILSFDLYFVLIAPRAQEMILQQRMDQFSLFSFVFFVCFAKVSSLVSGHQPPPSSDEPTNTANLIW